MTKGQAEFAELAGAMRNLSGNLPLLPGIFANYEAPIVPHGGAGKRELAKAKWGLPTSKDALFKAAVPRADVAKQEFLIRTR